MSPDKIAPKNMTFIDDVTDIDFTNTRQKIIKDNKLYEVILGENINMKPMNIKFIPRKIFGYIYISDENKLYNNLSEEIISDYFVEDISVAGLISQFFMFIGSKIRRIKINT